ncbi:MAG: sugar ABC transporter ATP-binding protein [Planctomycetales bacterium]|nr:sugar ABC transporter ATP-binding protein [Planctomycetales bacterium]
MVRQPANTAPLLEMRGIEKSFPGVRALDGVDLRLEPGEVLALLGENGAGKSTLIKMLGGALQPDRGDIVLAGEAARFETPAAAIGAGIGVIYQEFNLIPELTAWENIFLGREPSLGRDRRRDERRAAQALFERIGASVPLDVPCRRLSIAQQQLVEIAKALSHNVRLLVLDEPSATLAPREIEHLFAIIRELAARQIGVIYISHRLDEIFAIADRVSVLRDGRHVADAPIGATDRGQLIEWMVGRTLEREFPKHQHPLGEPRLVVEGLCRGAAVRNVSFHVRRGEVLGITGLIGSGRTEVARLIFGADRMESGTITLDGEQLTLRGPRDAIREGICLLTEDRKSQGLVLGLTVRENFGLPNLPQLSQWGFVRQSQERKWLAEFVDTLRIKIPHQEQLAKNLSGGNQQKVVLAKWLQQDADVVIFDEPTRGIDVGAKYEIYLLINELASQGKAVVMISSELPEIIGMSDRILVMHEGSVTGEIDDVATATQQQIMTLAVERQSA